MAVAVVGDDVTGGDIGIDMRRAVAAPFLLEMARIDEEGGLGNAGLAQRRDQPVGPLLRRHEGAGTARHVVEGERDPFLSRSRSGACQNGHRNRRNLKSFIMLPSHQDGHRLIPASPINTRRSKG